MFGPITLERAMGIEPTSEAWEALYKTLKVIDLAALSFPGALLSGGDLFLDDHVGSSGSESPR